MEIKKLQGAIEATLLSSGDAVLLERTAEALGLDRATTVRLMKSVMDSFNQPAKGIRIIQLENQYQMCSADEHGETVRRTLDLRRNTPLSQTVVEVLTAIAYQQSVTKAFVEQVRGVDGSGVISNLCEKGPVEERGRLDLPDRPLLYGTTPDFLRCMNLPFLSNLPPLPQSSPKDLEEEEDETTGKTFQAFWIKHKIEGGYALMTWVWILLGFLGLLVLALAARVKIYLSFEMEDGFSGEARYLSLHYCFPIEEGPKKEAKKKKKEEKKKGKPDKEQSVRDIIKEKGFTGFLNSLSELASIVAGAAKRLFSHFILKELKIRVVLGVGDATTTAVLYGMVSGVVHPTAGTLVAALRCKYYDVLITPDFNGEKFSTQMPMDGSVRLVFLIAVGPYALLRYVKMVLRQKREEGCQAAMVGEAAGKS